MLSLFPENCKSIPRWYTKLGSPDLDPELLKFEDMIFLQ